MGDSRRIRIVAGAIAVVVTAAMYLLATRDGADSLGDEAAGDQEPDAELGEPGGSGDGSIPPPQTTTPVPLGDTDLNGLSFTDVTAQAGLAAPHSTETPTSGELMNGAAAAGDYDADGDIDLVLTRIGLPNLLYRNDGAGHFTDVAVEAGVAGPVPPAGAGTPILADVDGNATLDLFLTGNPSGGRALYLNNGDGTFVDGLVGSGLESDTNQRVRPQGFGAALADWDHDGDLDLVTLDSSTEFLDGPGAVEIGVDAMGMCERTERVLAASNGLPETAGTSALYSNNGDGTFTDVTDESGLALGLIAGFTPLFSDIDGDGWEDLLVTGDLCTSRVFRNDDGAGFTDVTADSGVGTDENGRGSVVADVDADGNLDWFITSVAYPPGDVSCQLKTLSLGCSGNRLFLGDGEGSFSDATDEYGVRDGYWGWGAAAEDLNNDGWRDIVMTNGFGIQPTNGTDAEPGYARFLSDPTLLWLGRAEPPLPEIAPEVGLDDIGSGKALVAFDSDSDGDLDLLVVNTGAEPILYRNDTPAGGNWATIRVSQPGPNPTAVGARVRVFTTDRGDQIPLEVRSGGSLLGSSPLELHVGLGEESIERIEVLWPGESDPQVVAAPAVNSVIAIVREGS